jgi:hypothetical protein
MVKMMNTQVMNHIILMKHISVEIKYSVGNNKYSAVIIFPNFFIYTLH